MSRREDLLALTPPALASLANMGLLKRAQKELEQGKVPAIDVDADGTVNAAFEDGARTKLVPGKGLKDSPCSCGAAPMCRHRVGAVLAYQRMAGEVAAPAGPPWSPADVDDAALERLLGPPAVQRARLLVRRGVLAEVRRGTFEGEDLPLVHLATSTVRFLVPRDVGHARCDCTLRTGCEHVALAVWAFREAARKDAAAKVVAVEIADEGSAASRRLPGALAASVDLAAAVLFEGAVHLPAAAATRFALARAALEQAGLAWPLEAVEELESLLDAYQRRSARYSVERLAAVIAELFARARAGAGAGELPARAVLGSDEALEARLDQLRLAGLGARILADGGERTAEVYFADLASSGVLVLRRSYAAPAEGAPDDGPALAGRAALAGSPLGIAASGQVVSNAAVRKANRVVSFATGALKKTSVVRGAGDLDGLPGALVIGDVAAFLDELRARPPRVVRPRLAAENVRVVRVAAVDELAYDEGEQAVIASCRDLAEHTFTVRLAHRAVAPGALEGLALAFASGAVRAVAGDVRKTELGLVVEPIAVVTDRLLVLDLEPPSKEGASALAALPHVSSLSAASPLAAAIARASAVIDEAPHNGLRTLGSSWIERLRGARLELGEVGLVGVAGHLERLEEACAAARTTGAELDERAAAEAWATAALALELAAELG